LERLSCQPFPRFCRTIKRDRGAEVKIARAVEDSLRGLLDRIFGRSRETAAKQEANPDALDRESDPRDGVQPEEYRAADPRDLVEQDGTVMSGPAGA
jgi:hypothetical protein